MTEEGDSCSFFNCHEYVVQTSINSVQGRDVLLGGSDLPSSEMTAGSTGDSTVIESMLTDFPNPYVPHNSTAFKQTRIVRIPRIFDTQSYDDQNSCPQFSEYFPGTEPGALTPTFDENGVSHGLSSKSPLESYLTHQEFQTIIKGINERLLRAYYPWTWRNVIGNILSFFTLYMSDYFIKPQIDIDLAGIELFIKTTNESLNDIKIMSLKRSGYLSLDFQIPSQGTSLSS
ncbi:Shr5p [Sugiyamaella lignohabitans]|uniref:Ras modification protein ERF4 n=1 Tax=Sugiyamaella lignohabitans TaxID=796027 RepID=A0A167CLL5_9ASCO|nr:Shr5p [Sugiyamaella lignohabitans]ANB11856.1 Shr5p [Sugiyamaella lignohabitans]